MQYAILQYDICPAHGGVQGNQTAAGDGTQASRLRDNSMPSAAGEINGTQASRLRKSSLPSAAGETPAYQRESSLPSAAGEINGTQASRLRDSSLPSAAGENLHCELLAFTNDMGIKLVRHDLPDGCKDFADYWAKQSVHHTPVPS